ncbi:bifunctional aspartate kinase/homoserine dehydrogenase I [Aliikangiella coralliicola]|uniref:Bifunctional aspartokinase/homoserine dehydrogenase n=1 Tax=Aliikangiella coralliicola TaxID=2592383 RepID=A0A545U6F8_9GAMM|nr:bifunctional aspartate kinase/homoserine dehydrogenase I [Aliikangiella coralliicola]TQV85052.1 bifunctional aspartate kinase/homoserine dehydrogenase I [Aliikangiella coralliicola]
MKVLKFGGSSLANTTCFKQVANIVHDYGKTGPIAVVLSAPQGITNLLVSLVDSLNEGNSNQSDQELILQKLSAILEDSFTQFPSIDHDAIAVAFEDLSVRLNQLVQGAKLLSHCPSATQAQILGTGEKFSVALLNAILQTLGNETSLIDPEKFLTIDDRAAEPVAELEISKKRFSDNYSNLSTIAIMPGFFGVKLNGETGTLGRNGSDYSAAILAVCVQAKTCEIWTDVDGVYNADPRLVADAHLIDKMSYHEAMELSYFGAKVLHPKTIAPLSQNQIRCRIKNTHSPQNPGTLISSESTVGEMVKAISNLSDVAMINVSGPGMKGMVGMASRVFSAISLADISVIMISQSSAEYCISFCVPGSEAEAARDCLNQTFELELKNELLEPISVRQNLAVVTLVGDHMQQQKGIAAKFFKALSQARVNIIAIAQDSSERSISAVIRGQRTDDAIKVCHQNLFLKKPAIDAFVIGCGTVGKELIQQIHRQQPRLNDKNISLNVVGIANSRKLLLDKQGINLENWLPALNDASDQLSLQRLQAFILEAHLNNPVIIDCTSNEAIAMSYHEYLQSGFHVVTANKKANTASFDYYQKLRDAADAKQRRFLYETNVGAGLPVIDNLQGLMRAGDELVQFEGILSGSLSYIFGELHQGLSLSEATIKAKDLGYTEPNPAEDLSGLDVARKVLVIAREAGLELELSDIELEPVVPEELANITDADEFMRKLPDFDQTFQPKIEKAQQNGEYLRYIASIEGGKCKVGIQSVDSSHPLYSVADGENALALHTRYYQPKPYVIRGYGAGASVTAAGLFGDVLRTLAWDHEH